MEGSRKAVRISRIAAAVLFVLFFAASKDVTGFYLFYTLPYGLGLIFLPLATAALAAGQFASRRTLPAIVLTLLSAGLMFLFIALPDRDPQRMEMTVPETDTQVIVSLHRYSETSEKDFLTFDIPIVEGVLSRHAVYILPKSDTMLKERDIKLVSTDSRVSVIYYGETVAKIRT